MTDAVDEVTTGRLTAYSAAKKYDIPRQTLERHIHRPGIGSVGRPSALSVAQEAEIAETCQIFSEWGFGLTKMDIISVVADYFRHTKKPNPFKDGVPGDDWWRLFMKRHPELTKRKPQALQMVRAKVATPEVINHWFQQCLKLTLDELGLHDKPQCIFNVDESGFPLSGRPAHIVCKRGIKSPQAIIGGSGRENITVQVCVSADGKLVPPYVIYTGKYLMANCTNGGPIGSRYGVSPNGWMTTSAYIDWFRNIFIPSLPEERPVLLVLDGHSSHISFEVRELAIENGVHMLKLPPHLAHLLQPLDVGVFKPMKANWYSAVADFTRRERRGLTKREFPEVLSTLWKKYNPQTATGGFKGCGIHPYDDSVIPHQYSKYSEPFSTSSEHPSPEMNNSQSTSEPGPSPFHPSTQQSPEPSTQQSPEPSTQQSPEPSTTTNSLVPLSLVDLLEMDRNEQLSSNNITSPTQSSSTTTTPRAYIQHPSCSTPASDRSLQGSKSAETLLTLELKNYFGQLLSSSRPQKKTSSRKRLTGVGESLTSEEAMRRVQEDLEEKRRKEEEKMERKRKREEKRMEKKRQKSNGKCKRRKTNDEGNNEATCVEKQSKVVCIECETFYDQDEGDGKWIECEVCLNWYHALCVGVSEEEADDVQFVCDSCKTN